MSTATTGHQEQNIMNIQTSTSLESITTKGAIFRESSTLTPTWRCYHKRCNILRNSLFKASSCSPFGRKPSETPPTTITMCRKLWAVNLHSNLKALSKKISFPSNCSRYRRYNFHHIQIKFFFPVCLRALHFWKGCYSNSWPLDLARTNVP